MGVCDGAKMINANLEKRVTTLERELAKVKRQLRGNGTQNVPWWERIRGTFPNDAATRTAMRLGREYRQSTRPKRK